MKLAIGYSTRDQIELTEQTFTRLMQSVSPDCDIYWGDGSSSKDALQFFENCKGRYATAGIRGGADAAIAWKLSTMLASSEKYTHIGMVENDVLLDPDWLDPTLNLFEKGAKDGLRVGAVSPRSYVDRILIQRDGYAVMHNIGAGAIIFTREAAEIVLRSFRTHWWPDNVRLFGHIAGIDLRTYAAFRGQQQFVTTDWGWEAQLARHGLASLALTPAKCRMIGQNPPLAAQGLTLTSETTEQRGMDQAAFDYCVATLADIGGGMSIERPGLIHRDGASMLFFPHQLGFLPDFTYANRDNGASNWRLQWSQGFGPFAYRAGPGGASLSVHISGTCSFLLSGGAAGGKVTIEDHRSGFRATPNLPLETGLVSVEVPGTPVPRRVSAHFSEGTIFYGLQTAEPQMIDTTFRFDWTQLPEAE